MLPKGRQTSPVCSLWHIPAGSPASTAMPSGPLCRGTTIGSHFDPFAPSKRLEPPPSLCCPCRSRGETHTDAITAYRTNSPPTQHDLRTMARSVLYLTAKVTRYFWTWVSSSLPFHGDFQLARTLPHYHGRAYPPSSTLNFTRRLAVTPLQRSSCMAIGERCPVA